MGLLDKSYPLFFAILLCFVFGVNSDIIQDGYYWRDYDGLIPRDAVVGGQDENGEPIYIGQVLYVDKLLPAKIYPYDRNAYYAWGLEYTTKENVKILCSPYPERLKWVDTTKDGLHLLINTYLVKGGSEPSYDIYIGRAFHKMQTLIGRIRAGSAAYLNVGLYVTVPGKEIIFTSFEVLTYDPNATAVNDGSSGKCTKDIIFRS